MVPRVSRIVHRGAVLIFGEPPICVRNARAASVGRSLINTQLRADRGWVFQADARYAGP